MKRGADADAADVLRLALHYILRGGWTPAPLARPGMTTPPIGIADAALSIAGAIGRARQDLGAPWMRGVEADQEIRQAIGAAREDAPSIARWERAPGRTADEVKQTFKDAIVVLVARQQGAPVDVAA